MRALKSNTTASSNTAVGYHALEENTTGTINTAVGAYALDANTTASYNTAIGFEALTSQTTGGSNTAVGSRTLPDMTTGSQNCALGEASLYRVTTGVRNAGLGTESATNITTGGNNTCIGTFAGNSITTGNTNVIVGVSCQPSAASGSGQIVMGNSVTGTGNDNFTFGAGSTDSNIAFGATTITAPSDIRLKEDIQNEEVGLDFINDLRPVTFKWKKAKDVPSELNAHSDSEERVMNGKYNHGFIAQEVKEAIDKHNLKEGFDMWTEDESDGRQRVGDASLMPIMVKALQELSTQVDELKAEIQTLKGE